MSHALQIATLASLPLALLAEGATQADVPEWVHLLPRPADGLVGTFDGREYRLGEIEAVIQASFEDPRGLVIDENHATDLAAPKGEPAPARGWITELQARDDGIWGRVDWTPIGRRLLAHRAYRGISPVIAHDKAGQVLAILRASLVNRPNLRGLTALHQEQNSMTLLATLAGILGLAATATDDDVASAVRGLKTDTSGVALQAALTEIGTALGVSGDQAAIVAAAKVAKAGTADVTSLQAEVTTLRTQVKTLTDAGARSTSEAYIDGEMAKGRVGLNATTREDLVSLHMSQPDTAKRIVEAMPVVGPGASGRRQTPPNPDGSVGLNAEQVAVATALGISQADYLKTLKTEEAA